MKQIIKDLISFKKDSKIKSSLKDSYEKMEFSDLSNLISWLLHWQKDVKYQITDNEDFFFEDHMLLDDALERRYKSFFEYCPTLLEVFKLKDSKITYNSNVTDQEKQEILDFIDENHEIKIVKIRKK